MMDDVLTESSGRTQTTLLDPGASAGKREEMYFSFSKHTSFSSFFLVSMAMKRNKLLDSSYVVHARPSMWNKRTEISNHVNAFTLVST